MLSVEESFGLSVIGLLGAGIVSWWFTAPRLTRLRADSLWVQALVSRGWRGRDALLWTGMLVLFALPSIVSMWVRGGAAGGGRASEFSVGLLLPLVMHGAVALGILVVAEGRSGGWKRAFGSIHVFRDFVRAGVALLAMAPVGFGVALGWAALLASVGVEPVKQDVVQIMLSPETAMGVKIYFVGLAVVVAPVSEELVFRGVLLPAALRWTRPWFAVALVSGAFAAIHLHIDSFPMLFLLSAGLCVAHISSGRLSVCMAMHAMFNATSIAVMFLAEWLLKSMPG